MDYEDILKKCGDYGLYQKKCIYGFLVPLCLLAPWFFSINIFMTSEPDHWCHVDQLSNVSYHEQKHLISPPLAEAGKFNKCAMYDIDYDRVAETGALPNMTAIPIKSCANGWRYDHTNYDENAVTHLDLVCDKTYYQGLVLSGAAIGTLVGTPFFGWLSDQVGRRRTLVVMLIVHVLTCVSPILIKGLFSFLFFRMANSVITPALYQVSYVITNEMIGPDMRAYIAMLTCTGWAVGLTILPGVVYLTKSWVWMTAVSMGCGVVLLLLTGYNRESARWLLSKGRLREAADVLKEMAFVNGKEIPSDEELMEWLTLVGKNLAFQGGVEDKRASTLAFFKYPRLRLFFVSITLSWIGTSVAYYGLTIHSINLHGNQFANFFLLAVIEIPGYFIAWYAMESRLGRRWSNVLGMSIAGVFLCLPAFFPASWTVVTILVTAIAKLGVTITGLLVYQQAVELYPTPIRNQGMALSATFSAAVNIFLPQIALLSRYAVWIPMFLIGSMCLLSAFVASFIPETLNSCLPQTIDEGVIFAKDIPFWSLASTKPKSSLPDVVKAKSEHADLMTST